MTKKISNTLIFKLSIFILLVLTPVALSSCTTKGGDSTKSNTTVKKGKDLSIWFVQAKGENLELVKKTRSKTDNDLIKSAIDQLLLGPDENEMKDGISSEIPKGTILLGIETKDDNIELNLSKRFSSGGGPMSMEMRLNQLTKTVSTLAGDKKVFLNVEGERLSAMGLDGLEVKQPIN